MVVGDRSVARSGDNDADWVLRFDVVDFVNFRHSFSAKVRRQINNGSIDADHAFICMYVYTTACIHTKYLLLVAIVLFSHKKW
jgi:hypothetical protein